MPTDPCAGSAPPRPGVTEGRCTCIASCEACGSVNVIVHTLDSDPLVANQRPDVLRCLTCGRTQSELEQDA